MSDQQPATKQDLADLEARLAAILSDIEARLSANITDVETKLLGAYFSYQEHERIQFQHLKADTGNATKAAELRIDNLEHRLLEVERKLLTDPPH